MRAVIASALLLMSCASQQVTEDTSPAVSIVPGAVHVFTYASGIETAIQYTFSADGTITSPNGGSQIDIDYSTIIRWRYENGIIHLASKYRTMIVEPVDSIQLDHRSTWRCKIAGLPVVGYSYKESEYSSYGTHLFITNKPREVHKACMYQISEARKDSIKQLSKRFGMKYAPLIADQKIRIGMSKDMVIASIGEPQTINRTVTRYGVSEQWVYSRTYLYFDGETLTSFQD